MYRKVKRSDVPKRERKSESRFEGTTEWRRMKADIDRGLRRGESCYAELSPADWERMGLSAEAQEGRNTATGARSVCRFIQRYLDAHNVPYTVRTIHKTGMDYIIVDGPDD